MSTASYLCTGCARARPKRESHLAEQGLLECELIDVDVDVDVDVGMQLRCFDKFARHRHVDEPFRVVGQQGVASALPFQFHPSTIRDCSGVRLLAEPEAPLSQAKV